jgi:hypothetical protein
MAAATQHLVKDTKASQAHAALRQQINKLSTHTKSRSFYNILNSLQSEAYYLPKLWYDALA